ncbi:unnamed protein product (macronuclear) [Paramecium tetraurelia]|uniref:Uncharacterized protein n=1 Tax=Paramecium tetraurelia TaxID=5888 RepID=A0E575_PARTE|nr:uncharacterized protein GSPATT00023619001 [Paramecium tetraurelia]CAK90442.1 unnamed protein product [Paramecium tetraurelia]|eukprot:XP_001457839.1 hypothetical protein (macronuclear) [Paramecium tetraurelia strain d4-2]
MIREKRELFRVQIRKEKNEQIFTKKRTNITQSIPIDFPKVDYDQLISKTNLPQCLDNIDQFLTSKTNIDPQIIQALIPGAQITFDLLQYFPYECSKFLTNFTYHMNREQMIQLLTQSQILNLNNLLNGSSDELKENLTKIICNFIVELNSEEALKLAQSLQLLSNIYYSYTTHGCNERLSMNYLRIIAHLFFNNYKEQNMEYILEIIDNISQSTVDDDLKLQSFKTMRAIIGSYHINQFEIVNQFDKFLIIEDGLSAFNAVLQEQKVTELGIQALKMFNAMLQKNKQLMKLLLEKYSLLTFYCNALSSNLNLDKTIIKLIYEGFLLIIEDDNNFVLNEQDLCFEKIVTQVQVYNKKNKEFPSNTCSLITQLLKSRYKEQTIIEFPILKLISEFYQSEKQLITIDDYLFIAFTVLQTGEMIYPDRYVGEFLKYQGESIIQDIQKNTNDFEHMQLIDEIIKMAEYDEEVDFYH